MYRLLICSYIAYLTLLVHLITALECLRVFKINSLGTYPSEICTEETYFEVFTQEMHKGSEMLDAS